MRHFVSLLVGFAFLGLCSTFIIAPSQTSPTQETKLTPTVTTSYSAHVDWSPLIEAFDNVEMALVPAGCFDMGATDEQITEAFNICSEEGCRLSSFENASPSHEICFEEPFWIDRYEVSNAQITNSGIILSSGAAGHWTDDKRPRESVSWLDANEFCEQRGARLPTEAEWEYAARGPHNIVFPWGNVFDPNNVVYRVNSNGETAPIGSRENDISWVGAYDMSGNVSEWVSTIYDSGEYPYPYADNDGREAIDIDVVIGSQRVLRGGNWQSDESRLRSWYRSANNVIDSSSAWGFRCARPFD